MSPEDKKKLDKEFEVVRKRVLDRKDKMDKAVRERKEKK